ncbi:uncharacterized protein LOC129715765 [Leucoraja erinacea]|uniref:uncharacterized protein LOC129715765 n=1 Tax=Leucoraja erinaceus TaxID=7782 RepID=UPI002454FF0B|nr:uncharacterized protein LOC129715765 [Leucoraja erinacea]
MSPHNRICNVSFPVFRSSMQVSFRLEFEFVCTYLADEVELLLSVMSDSSELNQTLHDNAVRAWAAVRYEADLLLTSESSPQRHEVTPVRDSVPEGTHPTVRHTFQINNLGCFLPRRLEAKILVPTAIGAYHHFARVTTVSLDPSSGGNCSMETPTETSHNRSRGADTRAPHRDLRHLHRLDCNTAACSSYTCPAGTGQEQGGALSPPQLLPARTLLLHGKVQIYKDRNHIHSGDSSARCPGGSRRSSLSRAGFRVDQAIGGWRLAMDHHRQFPRRPVAPGAHHLHPLEERRRQVLLNLFLRISRMHGVRVSDRSSDLNRRLFAGVSKRFYHDFAWGLECNLCIVYFLQGGRVTEDAISRTFTERTTLCRAFLSLADAIPKQMGRFPDKHLGVTW